jgi:hypothetical protein
MITTVLIDQQYPLIKAIERIQSMDYFELERHGCGERERLLTAAMSIKNSPSGSKRLSNG